MVNLEYLIQTESDVRNFHFQTFLALKRAKLVKVRSIQTDETESVLALLGGFEASHSLRSFTLEGVRVDSILSA